MKTLVYSIVLILISINLQAQSLVGAWEHRQILDNGQEIKSILIVTEGY